MRTDAKYWHEVTWDIYNAWLEADTPERSEELHDAFVLADKFSKHFQRREGAT